MNGEQCTSILQDLPTDLYNFLPQCCQASLLLGSGQSFLSEAAYQTEHKLKNLARERERERESERRERRRERERRKKELNYQSKVWECICIYICVCVCVCVCVVCGVCVCVCVYGVCEKVKLITYLKVKLSYILD